MEMCRIHFDNQSSFAYSKHKENNDSDINDFDMYFQYRC